VSSVLMGCEQRADGVYHFETPREYPSAARGYGASGRLFRTL